MEALIDADIIAYRCACTCEDDPEDRVVLYRCNDLTERILTNVSASSFSLYLSGDNNFRYVVNPQYKANRKDKPRPKWLQVCREFLVTEWKATVTEGIEADDALGIRQHDDSVICSIDKDLLQIPGKHYNFVKEEFQTITPEQGLKNFWTQMVVGDVADNVFGIRGLGPVKTKKILDSVEGDTLEELDNNYYDTVCLLYQDFDRMHSNAKLLWILREEGGIWLEPNQRQQRRSQKWSGHQEGLKLSSLRSYEQEADDGLQSIQL